MDIAVLRVERDGTLEGYFAGNTLLTKEKRELV